MARRKWTKEKIINEIIEIQMSNEDITSSNVQKTNSSLFNAARKYFGGWKQAVESSGIDYSTITIFEYGKWNKKTVIAEIQRLYNEFGDVSPTFIRQKNDSLYTTSKNIFGTYNNALKEAGLDSSAIYRKKPSWSDGELKEEILRIYRTNGGTLSEKYFREHHYNIVSTCQIRYGGWYHTLKLFELPTDEVKVRWSTEEQILEEIKAVSKEGKSLAYSNVSNHLYLKASRVFGSWDNTLRAVDINPDEHRMYTRWSKSLMIEKIKEYHNQGLNMCWASIRHIDSALASSFIMYFDDWDAFLQEAEITDFNFDVGMGKTVIGYQFQFLLKQVFKALNLKLEYEKTHGNIRPDFTLNNTTWIDAKLSSWTAFSDGTLAKYCDKINHLIIVYLRGNEIERNENVTFIHVDDFFPALRKKGKNDLVEQIIALREKVSLIEKAS